MPGSESLSSFPNPSADAAAQTLPGQPAKKIPSHPRQFIESLLCLALAVIVFRCFAVEGYMISTGSMAPALLGFHKQVVCPTCGFPFAYGVSYQPESSRTISGDGDEEDNAGDVNGQVSSERQLCTCPNCGQRAIDISQVPRNQGDQLLVFREAYWLRKPRRWEVIVFRNPYETSQAYVKRLAGLPGETIEIRNGDVYADGTLCQKDYTTQKAVRIPVYDHDYEPSDDPEWLPRWRPDAGWERNGQGFVMRGINAAPKPDPAQTDPVMHGLSLSPTETPWTWLTYGHYLRSGGRHLTAVPLPIVEEQLQWPAEMLPARFDVKTRQLMVTGVLPVELWERLRQVSPDAEYREAVDQLYHRSRLSPVMDDYGYNRLTSQSSENAVRDLMLSVQLNVSGPSAEPAADRQFAIDMTDGENAFRLVLDFGRREVQLREDPDANPLLEPLRTAPMPAECETGSCQVEMSLIDRQVTVAIDGKEIFPAWPISQPLPKTEPPRFPVRLGSRGLAGGVDSLQLFRDVYYTSKPGDKPFTLKNDELYVLGDNSPVSLDSRRWKNGAVPLRLLLGKPFVVHLPSRQMKIRIGESTRHIRIPDFPRVRYIR